MIKRCEIPRQSRRTPRPPAGAWRHFVRGGGTSREFSNDIYSADAIRSKQAGVAAAAARAVGPAARLRGWAGPRAPVRFLLLCVLASGELFGLELGSAPHLHLI